jgi:tRNA(Ile)-lysidine synthase
MIIQQSMQLIMQQLPQSKPDQTWWVGFSGGLDSSVLLHILKSTSANLDLVAIHINHQISPNADYWQQHCEDFCRRLGVELVTEKVTIQNRGKGIEDAARVARYQVFDRCMKRGDYLFTAHHADDQTETMLLRLLRGTGSRGLAGIASERLLNQSLNTTIFRPLLQFTRNEILAYAKDQKIKWIEDESNFSEQYDRNYLRLNVIPLLQSRWPGMQKRWQQTAQHCAETEGMLIELATGDLSNVELRNERVGQSINRSLFSDVSTPRQHNLLRNWLSIQGYSIPEKQHWDQIHTQIFSEKSDSSINLQWGNVSLRVFQNRIFLLPQTMPEFNLFMTECIASDTAQLLRADLPDLHVRNRQGGERCKPADRNHSQTLKKCLQEFGLEPWLRDKVPLIYSQDNLVAVGDLWICAEYLAQPNETGLKLSWK